MALDLSRNEINSTSSTDSSNTLSGNQQNATLAPWVSPDNSTINYPSISNDSVSTSPSTNFTINSPSPVVIPLDASSPLNANASVTTPTMDPISSTATSLQSTPSPILMNSDVNFNQSSLLPLLMNSNSTLNQSDPVLSLSNPNLPFPLDGALPIQPPFSKLSNPNPNFKPFAWQTPGIIIGAVCLFLGIACVIIGAALCVRAKRQTRKSLRSLKVMSGFDFNDCGEDEFQYNSWNKAPRLTSEKSINHFDGIDLDGNFTELNYCRHSPGTLYSTGEAEDGDGCHTPRFHPHVHVETGVAQ